MAANGESGSAPAGEKFVIELQALASDVPAAIRLRQALKLFLRRFQLRCTKILPSIEAAAAPGETA